MATLAGATVVALFAWQQSRQSLVAACLSRGGAWDGSKSFCTPPRPVIMQRGLQRSQRQRQPQGFGPPS